MEPSYQTRKIAPRWLLAALLVITGLAAWSQFSSPFAKLMASRKNEDLYLAVMTSPATLIRYNPHQEKAWVREIPCKNCKTPTAQTFGLPENAPFVYYTPLRTKPETVWDNFKNTLETWRYAPLPLAALPLDYLRARFSKRTNLNLADAVLLGMELSKLEMNDFTLQIDTPRARKKAAAKNEALPQVEDRAPLAVEDRPIVVEVLNASGKRGLARALTQFLRDQNEKGLLRVDVLQYDNYPGGYLEQTRIVDYSGRLMQVKQLSTAIGCRQEIRSEPRGNAICDTRIILGKDFEMP